MRYIFLKPNYKSRFSPHLQLYANISKLSGQNKKLGFGYKRFE